MPDKTIIALAVLMTVLAGGGALGMGNAPPADRASGSQRPALPADYYEHNRVRITSYEVSPRIVRLNNASARTAEVKFTAASDEDVYWWVNVNTDVNAEGRIYPISGEIRGGYGRSMAVTWDCRPRFSRAMPGGTYWFCITAFEKQSGRVTYLKGPLVIEKEAGS